MCSTYACRIPDRNEMADITTFLDILVRKIKVPLMLDTTDAAVLEESLKRSQGKAIINSINLEDGEERFKKVVPLARRFGAALVVGCIDEDKQQAQAVTRERKLQVAERSFQLLTEKYGVEPEDIIFDPLVFPVGTGDKNYIGSGVETIEGIRLIKQALPNCKTVLGVSNVSFGLPEAGREVLNSVMLYHCVQAGLDLAIVNSEKLERYPMIPEEERKLAEDLIWWRGEDPIAAFAAHFRERKGKETVEQRRSLPLDERLALYILEGSKDGLFEDLNEALQARGPLEIINGPLMKGMDEVGRLFNANQMIVAEVLQSAEAMKAAVAHLEPHMTKAENVSKGKIILATVKGDVHDIGKNLVEIILGNNGYNVVNLGIKVPPEELIKAFREHRPDAIGLSGLLVKSAQMMVITAQDLNTAEIACPILVGGAALSNRFTRIKIAPEYAGLVAYANDAMNGLDLANQIMDREARESLKIRLEEETQRLQALASKVIDAPTKPAVVRASVRHDLEIPRPPDLKLHVLRDYDLGEIFDYINPKSLYAKHLGFKNFEEAAREGRYEGARVARCGRGSCASDDRAQRHHRQRDLQIFSRAKRRRSHRDGSQSRRQERPRDLHLRASERRARAMPRGLRRAARFGTPRLHEFLHDHHRHRRPRARRGMEEQGRLPALARAAGARARRRRGVRGVAARKNPRDVGNRRSGRHHQKGSLPGALSRQSLLAGLSRLPADGRSGADFPPPRSGPAECRCASDRGLHDGSRGVGQRDGNPSSGRKILQPVTRRHRAPGARAGTRQRSRRRLTRLPSGAIRLSVPLAALRSRQLNSKKLVSLFFRFAVEANRPN